jgi:hypothetical protein
MGESHERCPPISSQIRAIRSFVTFVFQNWLLEKVLPRSVSQLLPAKAGSLGERVKLA